MLTVNGVNRKRKEKASTDILFYLLAAGKTQSGRLWYHNTNPKAEEKVSAEGKSPRRFL